MDNEKAGIDQTKKYIDSLQDIRKKKHYKNALNSLLTNHAVSKSFNELENKISNELLRMDSHNEDLSDISVVVDKLSLVFNSIFPIEYSLDEKFVFYLLVIYKFIEGDYDENDI